MASSVIRSKLSLILLAVRGQLMLVLDWPEELVVIDANGGSPDERLHQQAEHYVVIQARGAQPEESRGTGRVWSHFRRQLVVTVWTRLALDEVGKAAVHLTEASTGHYDTEDLVADALDRFAAENDNADWLVECPLHPSGDGEATPQRKDRSWLHSEVRFDLVYARDLDQSRQ